MGLRKKVSDFIMLEDGNVGQSSALRAGSILTSTVLGGVLLSLIDPQSAEGAPCHGDGHADNHYDGHDDWTCSPC